MKGRYLQGVGLLAAVTLVLSGGTAFAASGTAPQKVQTDITFKSSKPLPMEGTRFDGAYVASTKRVYFLGWRMADDSTTGEVWYYDLGTKAYVDTGTAMPVPISNYQIAQLTDPTGDGLYVFGGRSGDAAIVSSVQVYYPATNTAVKLPKADKWPGKTPSGCTSLPAMGVTTVGNQAVVMGGVAFTANGCIADENSKQTWVFNPMHASGQRWRKGPALNMARGYITPAVVGGKVYAIGGDVNDAATLVPQTIVESWDLSAHNPWKNGPADLPEACDESQAFAFDSGPLAKTITLAGCGQWPNALPDVLQFDQGANSWSTVGSLLESRRNQAGASIGTNSKPKMFVAGGYAADGATALATTEIGTISTAPFVPRAPQAVRGSAGRSGLL